MRAIKAYSKSSSFTVSFIFMTLLFAGVAFNTYVLTVANDDLLIRETEAALVADIGGFRSLYKNGGASAVIEAIDERVAIFNNDFFYLYRDKNGEYLAGNLAKWPSNDVELVRNGLLDIEATLRPGSLHKGGNKTQAAIGMVVEFGNRDSLLVARSVQQYEFSVWLAQTSSWVMIIIVSIISILSIGVAYYVVSRINLIADTADKIITSGNLSERLYVEGEWDDLSKLTLTLNDLLDRLEQSFHGIRSVADNIAHDLRTPLTRLKSQIEQLPEQAQKYELSAECDNILAIFNSLLRITYIETNAQKAGFETCNVSLVLEDAVDLYHPIMEEKHIRLSVDIDADIYCHCDRSLIFQVFANVIDNAVKFTPENGDISIVLTAQDNYIRFSASDSGLGVEESTLDKMTERFFREDKSRTTSGNGLGLSLVAAIVSLHQGTIMFERRQPTGLSCHIRLPILNG